MHAERSGSSTAGIFSLGLVYYKGVDNRGAEALPRFFIMNLLNT